ncbi:MAG: hypothetical protein HY941_09845 [Gammaproteobacteria bacterium]|nr:hypothetical protein [Gammaproteobacteria bacterium]
MKAKDFIKLGTALRYLIDVREGEPLGGKHVLQNIETVLVLVRELEFTLTLESAGIAQLVNLGAQLRSASTTTTTINKEQAAQLERICRKVRESLLTEGEGIQVFTQAKEVLDKPLPLPEHVTLKWLSAHVPVPLWLAFLGLLGGAYSLGVGTCQLTVVRDIFKLDATPKVENDKSRTLQPNNQINKGAAR